MAELKINKIINQEIFVDDFRCLSENNIVKFRKNKHSATDNGIAIVYAPNGTGKTTLTNMLDKEQNIFEAELEIEYKTRKNYLPCRDNINVIFDQNNRNIIKGEPNEFIISKDIAKIAALEKAMMSAFEGLVKVIKSKLKIEYNISTIRDLLLNDIEIFQKQLVDIVNNKTQPKQMYIKAFIEESEKIRIFNTDELIEDSKVNYIIDNYHKNDSVLKSILDLDLSKIQKVAIQEFEQTGIAVKILDKYCNKDECIVCDNKINRNDLLDGKRIKNEEIRKKLNKYMQDKIVTIIGSEIDNDTFDIKKIITSCIEEGSSEKLTILKDEINKYIKFIHNKILQYIKSEIKQSNLIKIHEEIQILIENQPTIEGEDIIFLQEIISNNLERELKIEFDKFNNKKLKLTLVRQLDDGKEIHNDLLEVERNKLNLSSGEQNFISLAFEFMRTKNKKEEIIVIDDPISSFDSIYKNKIIYCINSLAKEKKCLVFTHNMELVKLLNGQEKNTFNFYLFQNKENSNNGFIKVDDKEIELILELNKLINMFRTKIYGEIKDYKLFLMSLIPFMRGYANLVGNTVIYSKLSEVMHNTKEDKKIDLTNIYNELFVKSYEINNKNYDKDYDLSEKQKEKIKQRFNNLNYISETVEISAKDIIEITNSNVDLFILKESTKFKLLNKTLKHTLIYLALKLLVEKNLLPRCDDNIQAKYQDGESISLGMIIDNALKDDKENKVFFTSRKTLVNDFNHFEGNIDIFQPAIDIKDSSLEKEVILIKERISQLNSIGNILSKNKIKDKEISTIEQKKIEV